MGGGGGVEGLSRQGLHHGLNLGHLTCSKRLKLGNDGRLDVRGVPYGVVFRIFVLLRHWR